MSRFSVRACAACGKAFTAKTSPCYVARGWSRWCSPQCYQVSYTSPEEVAKRFWCKVDKNGPVPSHMPHLGQCWVWTAAKARYGYGRFGMRGRNSPAHRAVLLMAGARLDGLVVMHKCDNPPCVNPQHLSVGTTRDNIHDMIAKGRAPVCRRDNSPKGEASGRSKLKSYQVLEIRKLAGTMTQHAIAVRYNVCDQTISNITRRRDWRHLAD